MSVKTRSSGRGLRVDAPETAGVCYLLVWEGRAECSAAPSALQALPYLSVHTETLRGYG